MGLLHERHLPAVAVPGGVDGPAHASLAALLEQTGTPPVRRAFRLEEPRDWERTA